jgi:hypothetical protein
MKTTFLYALAGVLAAAGTAGAQSFTIDEIDVAGTPRHEGKPSHTVLAGQTAEIQLRITVPGNHPVKGPHFSIATNPTIAGATFVTAATAPASLAPGTNWIIVGRLPHLLPFPLTFVVLAKGGAGRFATPTVEATIRVLAPDLQARMPGRMEGWFEIFNAGDAPAAPTNALLTCRATAGGAGSGNQASDGPHGCSSLFTTDPVGRRFPIPELAPHQSHRVTLAHWDEIAWAPGTYEFAAVADIGNLVVEKMEGNNVAHSGMVVDAQGRVQP